MSIRLLSTIAAVAFLIGSATIAFAEPATNESVAEIKQTLDEQEATIRELKAQVEALENGGVSDASPPLEGPAAAVHEPGHAPAPAEQAEAEDALRYGHEARTVYRDNFNDKQSAAARPSDYTLDPAYRGFIDIPRTVLMIKFNAKPKVDMLASSGGSGSEFRFVPALFPVQGQSGNEGGWRVMGNANGSQLRMDLRAPSIPGNFRLYYQNDFFGDDQKHMRYRLQHLYGQFYGVVAGFTYGLFEDPDAWPDTVDYEAPNSVIFARRALIHYKRAFGDEFQVTVGLENPDAYIDTYSADQISADPGVKNSGAVPRNQAPDGGFNVRWTPRGFVDHMQFSTIFRGLGVDGVNVADQTIFAWGLNLSGSLNLTSKDTAQFWFVYGHGVGGMGNDTSFLDSDAAIDSSGRLRALEYGSAMGALTHHWTPRWRSTVTYGYVNLENVDGQSGDAYHYSHYGSANVVYQVFKRLSVGLEGLGGHKAVKDGRSVTIYRIQLGVTFSVFD